MNERSLSVLEQYDIECYDVFHGRDSFICRTDKGRKLLFPFRGSNERAELLYKLQLNRRENGECFADLPVALMEGGFVSEDIYGNRFMLKDWVEAPECNVDDLAELKEAMRALAIFHKSFSCRLDYEICEKFADNQDGFAKIAIKRNREISKVLKYIRTKNNKTNFEFSFLYAAEDFLEQGKKVAEAAEKKNLDELVLNAKKNALFSHGDFSQHEVLMHEGMAFVVHPEHFKCSVQVEDLAHLMRKVLEKNNWDMRIGEQMVNTYHSERALSEQELLFLKLKLEYPEKFWKLANRYYNSKKSWVSLRQEEKLEKLIDQDKKKLSFVSQVFT